MPAFCAVAYVNLHWRWHWGGEFDQAALAACFHCQMRTMLILDKELQENARSDTSLWCPILTLGPMPPRPGARRGMPKDKSKLSRTIHLIGVHLMGMYLTGVCLMGTHLLGVHLLSVCLMGMYLMGVHFMVVYLMGLRLIYVYFSWACISRSCTL